jgi:autophagy-related protein 33
VLTAASQGVSYTVSTVSLPVLLELPSSAGASHAVRALTGTLPRPVLALSCLASAPLLLSFALSPRAARHPYLLYTSLLAVLSAAAPSLLPSPIVARPPTTPVARKPARAARNLEASYEVLGDAHSEPASEEDLDDVNGEEVRAEVEGLVRAYAVRTGLAALGFAMAVVGIWGDGAPQAVVYVS